MSQESTRSAFDQKNTRRGIKEHGEKMVAAIVKEYQQLKDADTLKVLDASKLSATQRQGTLELLTLIKKKRCGKSRVRCALMKKNNVDVFGRKKC